jgi:ABC-2 type transport system permease protein
MFDVFLAVIMGTYLFDVPLRGSGALVFAASAVFLAGVLSIGMFFSIATKSQIISSQLAMTFTYLPALLLSGFMFTIANMPRALQVVTYVVPARYFVGLLRSIYLKGLGLEFLAFEAALLVVFSLAVAALATLAFKKKLA